MNEVRFRGGRIVREGFKTTLSELRLSKTHRSARLRWRAQIPEPSIFVFSRERAKLGYFWRHSYLVPESGPFLGNVVNPDTGRPVIAGEDQLRRPDFRKIKHAETVTAEAANSRRTFFSPLWQADRERIPRMAPIEFIGRYEPATFCTTSLCI